jgi:hypothetical protein
MSKKKLELVLKVKNRGRIEKDRIEKNSPDVGRVKMDETGGREKKCN